MKKLKNINWGNLVILLIFIGALGVVSYDMFNTAILGHSLTWFGFITNVGAWFICFMSGVYVYSEGYEDER